MKKWLLALMAIAVLVAGGWFAFRDRRPSAAPDPVVQAVTPSRGVLPGTAANISTPVQLPKSAARLASPATEQSTSAAASHFPSSPAAASPPLEPNFESTNLPPATILENMRTVIRQYGSTFGGNPVGTNPEITKALQGDNPKHINFLKPDGNRVNANGELVDAWGTPYFFHQLSGNDMEIRSAGPDRVMYTADDVVIK